MIKNYYQILGVDQNATQEEIKQAYRLYAKKFHPDLHNNDNFFKEKFEEINEAHTILSDEGKRKLYDFLKDKPTESKIYNSPQPQQSQPNKKNFLYFIDENYYVSGEKITEKNIHFDYFIKDIKDVVYKIRPSYILVSIGILILLLGIKMASSSHDDPKFFAYIILIPIGIFLLFSKTQSITLIYKNGKKYSVITKWDNMKKIATAIQQAIRENGTA